MNMSVRLAGQSAAGLFQGGKSNILQNKNAGKLQENLSKMAAKANENAAAVKREAKAMNKANRVNVTTYTDKEGRVHKTFSGSGTNVVEAMKKYGAEKKKDDVKVKKRLQYSYQKVSNQVLMAKNSLSASKAVLSAKRGLADLQRKLKASDCSDDEKQAALSHAKRMISIAKKKKKHLDLEELVENTMKSDERMEKMTEGGESENFEKVAPHDDTENISEENAEDSFEEDFDDALLDEMQDEQYQMDMEDLDSLMTEELEEMDLSDEIAESAEAVSEEFMDEMSEDMSELLSEEMEELEEMMEIVNPHMDEEHFEKLKLKHRTEENKELVKADTDYLKAYIKSIQHQNAQQAAGAGTSSAPISSDGFAAVMADVSVDVSASADTSIGFSVTV